MDGYLIRVPPVLGVEIITLDADAVAEFKLLHVRWWSSRFVTNTEMHRNYTSVGLKWRMYFNKHDYEIEERLRGKYYGG